MAGPVSSVLGRCPQAPVVCTSSWLCSSELDSILDVSYLDSPNEETPTSETVVLLKLTQSSEADSTCALSVSCVAPGKHRMQNISIYSQARTIEVYSVDEEYLGTSRGKNHHTFACCEEDSPITLYKSYLKFDFPVHACTVKLLSLGGKQCIFLSKISIHLTSVPERSSEAPTLLGPFIDLEQVQSIMDSMGGKLSPGAEQLMSMVRAQQKHPAPFGAHLLQLLGGFNRGAGSEQQKERETQILSSNEAPETKVEMSQIPMPVNPLSSGSGISTQNKMLPQSGMKALFSSFLQNQMTDVACTPKVDSLLPLLHNMCIEKNNRIPEHSKGQEEFYSASGDEKRGRTLEQLVFVHMERMERTLIDHIDQKIKSLQEHLDAKLDLVLNVVQSNAYISQTLNVPEKLANGLPNHNRKQTCEINGLPSHPSSELPTCS